MAVNIYFLDNELNQSAQNWAEKIATQKHLYYSEHSGVFLICKVLFKGIGEIISIFPLKSSPKEIVNYWYSQHKKYEYETPGWQHGTTYFTQIVWRTSREVS